MVGRITGVFGIHGELKCDPTGAGRSVLSTCTSLRCQLEDRSVDVVLSAIRQHKRRFIVSLENCTDANGALRFVGAR
ncbi:MAG: hypothetical protein M3Z14_01710, partial [Candidatus Eremiobacteraeota bacterium]|nr:hypothetical protein [Candidatus Eremiobacteraeota bacterium]